jgi:Protein of unknown function (DUF3710)
MFRRRQAEVEPDEADAADLGRDAGYEADVRARGPWDDSEVTIEDDDDSRIDLGSLLVTPQDTVDVQLQVDEATNEVVAVILAAEDGAAEVRAFAAPRNGDIWEDSRKAVASEVAQRGGTATERQGPWGTELAVSLMVDLPEGGRAQQQSVVVGIAGPRWLLRATFFGRPTAKYDDDGNVETAVRDIVVRRGSGPVPPGEALPLTLPPGASPNP